MRRAGVVVATVAMSLVALTLVSVSPAAANEQDQAKVAAAARRTLASSSYRVTTATDGTVDSTVSFIAPNRRLTEVTFSGRTATSLQIGRANWGKMPDCVPDPRGHWLAMPRAKAKVRPPEYEMLQALTTSKAAPHRINSREDSSTYRITIPRTLRLGHSRISAKHGGVTVENGRIAAIAYSLFMDGKLIGKTQMDFTTYDEVPPIEAPASDDIVTGNVACGGGAVSGTITPTPASN